MGDNDDGIDIDNGHANNYNDDGYYPLKVKLLQVNTDEDPELKELFSVDTFPRVMLWSKRLFLKKSLEQKF